MIEKRVTQQLLEVGELALTEREREDLVLPQHSTTITIEVDGERFGAQWNGRSRRLSGDLLTERLQDYGQVGGLLRLRLVERVYRLQLLPPGTSSQLSYTRTDFPTDAKKSVAQKKQIRRATVDRQFHADSEYDWGPTATRTVGFLVEARKLLAEQLKAAGFDPRELVELRLQGEELATLDDFEELLAVDVANVDRMPHQEAVARHALSRLRGRAVLADEVGLGKTIEAGLAIKELTLRGLAKRVLILCPAPLRDQWREEMNHKFDLPFEVAYGGSEVGNQDKLILSLSLGMRQIPKLTKQPWDIVILDEAHRAAGEGARKTRELITGLTSACRYAFFLTATPVQNNLLELYRLVELLRPGTFTSVREFKRQYVSGQDPRSPRDPAALRRLISSAMIRTTRAQAGVDRVVRRAVDVPIDLGVKEKELYALSTDLLRNVMRESGDAMRRRSLALRLTASPFSMGTTALRMAERHPNSRVRSVLNEVGHLAMDISDSAREDTALWIARDWMREHGRVLVFTQHTDTVTGLLRRLELEGIHAVSFHGSMSPAERAATIAAFRSGDAPIMISTDAGAEGQNLQFCNCVLNYDLPWNPMRIEQRIGRVDRLTQPRDEVFIANLYARRTIDESVYRLLAEKLRMFELLFGQVTTILGELDDSKSATFESRVMEALFADNDMKMEGLLAQLGSELADARQRASTLIAADTGLSSWMASAMEHRKHLTKAGSNELAPEVTERARMRQRRVQAWVRQVLEALGAEFLHDTGDGDGAFLTASFASEFAEELGGRTVLHLAFDRLGMEHHPDAELCAVGSPVFDELLRLLRMRGDLHATVPVIPQDPGPSPFNHSQSITLLSRHLVPSGSWSGQATFRATVGEAETTEHVVTAELDHGKEVRLPRRPLSDGESLPAAFDDPTKIILGFEAIASKQLEALRRERSRQVTSQQASELSRIQIGYQAQIAEASYEDKQRLRRALQSEERRLDRQPDVRARAKLLAVTLDEDDWLVEETWTGPGGVEGSLTYEWGLAEAPEVISDASARAIRVLSLCTVGHWVDQSESTLCGSCSDYLCPACGQDFVFERCPICDVDACGRCRADTGGLCRSCASPERVPDLDEPYFLAWQLNRGTLLHVGERLARVVREGKAEFEWIVPDEDVHDSARKRTRSYAVNKGLPPNCGLALVDLSTRPSAPTSDRLQLRGVRTVTVELSTIDSQSSAVDSVAVEDLPQSDGPAVIGEGVAQLRSLLHKLRTDVSPPPPPAIVVTKRAAFTDTYMESDRLVEEVTVVSDQRDLVVVSERSEPLRWLPESPEDATIAEVQLDGVRVYLSRRNEAVLVTSYVPDGQEGHIVRQWISLPDDTSVAEQLAWYERLSVLAMPGGRVGQPLSEPAELHGEFPTPSECVLVDRTITRVAEITTSDLPSNLIAASAASLAALGGGQALSAPGLSALPASELSRELRHRSYRSFTAAVRTVFEINEIWQGHGVGRHQYRCFDGSPMAPLLDDIGSRRNDFGVCRDGHFYEVGNAGECVSCKTSACRACDPDRHLAVDSCPTCSALVCRRCLAVAHQVRDLGCVLCGDKACQDCGRDPEVGPCRICARAMCLSCRAGDLCPACAELRPAVGEELNGLPRDLAIIGAAVLIGSDANATTVLLDRGSAVEQVVIQDGSIKRWVAFGRDDVDSVYRLRIAASRERGLQVLPVAEPPVAETSIASPHIMIHTERTFYPGWGLRDGEAGARSSSGHRTPVADLAQLLTEEFPRLTLIPTAIAQTPPDARHALSLTHQPHTDELRMRWDWTGREIAITNSGIVDRHIDCSELTESLIPWVETATLPSWVSAEWNPVPGLKAVASTESVEAAVVEIASLLALGIRFGESTDWYTISLSSEAPTATALARWAGAIDVDEVGAFTNPNQILRSSVLNAKDVALRVTPVVSVERTARRGHPANTEAALRAWVPDAEIVVPALGSVPGDFRSALERQMRDATARSTLAIGARVEELVTLDDGRVWRHEVNLAPGQHDARRVDSVARVPLVEGVVDREGHFGPDRARCPYCGDRVCAMCADGLKACDCCEIAICRRCIREPLADLWLCPACSTMRQPTRSEARQHGRLLSTRKMLIGVDGLHLTVVEQSKQRWIRQGGSGEKHPVASPSVSTFLNERLNTTE